MKIKNPILLNPFFYFSLIWTMVIIVHSFSFTNLYPSLSASFYLFFFSIITISVVLMVAFQKAVIKTDEIIIEDQKKDKVLFWIIVLGFLAQVVYSRNIPLLETLRGVGSSYQNFGIPHFTFAYVTFVVFVNSLASVKFVYGKENKRFNLALLLACYGVFILSFSRGILLLCVGITAVIYLSSIDIKAKHIFILIILAIIGALLFNILGNIRMGDSWNDPKSILYISSFKEEYYFLKDISWTIVYVDSPIGNLAYNQKYIEPLYDVQGLIAMLLPDFIGKRIFPEFNSGIYLPQPGLTVSSMFAGGYKYFGIVGMIFAYLELVIVIILTSLMTKKNDLVFVSTIALLSVLCVLTFFDNMITYSGYSFPLIYLIIYYFIQKRKNRYVEECPEE